MAPLKNYAKRDVWAALNNYHKKMVSPKIHHHAWVIQLKRIFCVSSTTAWWRMHHTVHLTRFLFLFLFLTTFCFFFISLLPLFPFFFNFSLQQINIFLKYTITYFLGWAKITQVLIKQHLRIYGYNTAQKSKLSLFLCNNDIGQTSHSRFALSIKQDVLQDGQGPKTQLTNMSFNHQNPFYWM